MCIYTTIITFLYEWIYVVIFLYRLVCAFIFIKNFTERDSIFCGHKSQQMGKHTCKLCRRVDPNGRGVMHAGWHLRRSLVAASAEQKQRIDAVCRTKTAYRCRRCRLQSRSSISSRAEAAISFFVMCVCRHFALTWNSVCADNREEVRDCARDQYAHGIKITFRRKYVIFGKPAIRSTSHWFFPLSAGLFLLLKNKMSAAPHVSCCPHPHPSLSLSLPFTLSISRTKGTHRVQSGCFTSQEKPLVPNFWHAYKILTFERSGLGASKCGGFKCFIGSGEFAKFARFYPCNHEFVPYCSNSWLKKSNCMFKVIIHAHNNGNSCLGWFKMKLTTNP